jgi:hypothetical protein
VTTDRLPAILQAMQDDAHAAEDTVLAAGLAACIDLHVLAPLLPVNADDLAVSARLSCLIVDGEHYPLADADRALACRVAARMASTAALLLAVDPEGHLSTAEALWSASGKLSGLWHASHKAMRAIERADAQRLIARLDGVETLLRKSGEPAEDIPVTGAAPSPTVQVGDIIDAASVPPGTLVDRCLAGTLLSIRMPNGRGFHLYDDNEGRDSWPWWDREDHNVRVLATNLRGAEADRVAMMSPAEAREWLAQRVAATPIAVSRVQIKGDGGWTGVVQERSDNYALVLVDGETRLRRVPIGDLTPL